MVSVYEVAETIRRILRGRAFSQLDKYEAHSESKGLLVIKNVFFRREPASLISPRRSSQPGNHWNSCFQLHIVLKPLSTTPLFQEQEEKAIARCKVGTLRWVIEKFPTKMLSLLLDSGNGETNQQNSPLYLTLTFRICLVLRITNKYFQQI